MSNLLNKFKQRSFTADLIKNQLGVTKKESLFWGPTRDKAGNAQAVIRFLPPPLNEEQSIVEYYSHAFKDSDTGLWYIEKSRTTLGERDPLSEYNMRVWRASQREGLDKVEAEALRKSCSHRKRTQYYVANVLIISDKNAPENEGKVLPYRFGQKVLGKIMAAMEPPYDDVDPIDPFDLFEGANFRLRVRIDPSSKMPNYDDSAFDKPSALYDGDEDALEKLVNQISSLKIHVDPSTFKSYEDLSRRLSEVLGDKYYAFEETGSASRPAKRYKLSEASDDTVLNMADAKATVEIPWESELKEPEVPVKSKNDKPAKAGNKQAPVNDKSKWAVDVNDDDAALFAELEREVKGLG